MLACLQGASDREQPSAGVRHFHANGLSAVSCCNSLHVHASPDADPCFLQSASPECDQIKSSSSSNSSSSNSVVVVSISLN